MHDGTEEELVHGLIAAGQDAIGICITNPIHVLHD